MSHETRNNTLKGVVLFGAGLLLAACGQQGSTETVQQNGTQDSPDVIAHYQGSPHFGGSNDLDNVGRLGNWDVKLYEDHHADFTVAGGKLLSQHDIELLEGRMECADESSLHITAQPLSNDFISKQFDIHPIDHTETGPFAVSVCKAGELTVAGMDTIEGLKRVTG